MSTKISQLSANNSGYVGNEIIPLVKNGQTVSGAVSGLPFAKPTINNNFTTSQTINGSVLANTFELSGNVIKLKSIGTSGVGLTDATSTSLNHSILIGDETTVDSSSYSVFIGSSVGNSGDTITYSNLIGTSAGNGSSSVSYSNIIGYSAGESSSNSDYSNFIGPNAGQNSPNTTNSNLIGFNTGANSGDPVFGYTNTVDFIGNSAGQGSIGISRSVYIGPSTGEFSISNQSVVFIGDGAGINTDQANYANYIGYQAGGFTQFGYYSNFFGYYAGSNADNSRHSNFIGDFAGANASNSPYCVYIGSYAGSGADNTNNGVFIGNSAGVGSAASNNSILIGFNAGTSSQTEYSTVLGSGAGLSMTGSKNQLFGADTSISPTSLSGCLVLGYGAQATQNNTIAIGSTSTPFLTSGTGTNTNSYLVVRLNGVNRKIPIYT